MTAADARSSRDEPATAGEPTVEVWASRESQVGAFRVHRGLPRRARRTVGAWCFADHMGPTTVTETRSAEIGPHPHIGLQTVTWLLAGELLHRDSLGSEQIIRAGELNLMTAGHGVVHAEEGTGAYRGEFHGVQLWVAQPEATRQGDPAFEHHGELPRVDLAAATGTVIVGAFDQVVSPARRDTDHVGVDLTLRRGQTVVPLSADYEYALIVLAGAIATERADVPLDHVAYLGRGRDEIALDARVDSRALLLGGVPFEEPILMWWNFVARTTAEIDEAYASWQSAGDRFGPVESALARIPAPRPTWTRS